MSKPSGEEPGTPVPDLPFGAVMATGAASQLAASAGVGAVRVPLLWTAIVVALAAVASPGRRRKRVAATARLGDFTVPIGLAVIGSGLVRLGGPALVTGAAEAVVAGAWLTTGVLLATVVAPLLASPPGLRSLGGVSFLVPAALLADAVAASALVRLSGGVRLLGWLALAATGLGVIGYLVVAGLAGTRLVAHRVDGVPRAPWWIAAGCGGLSAAALGRVGALHPAGGGEEALRILGWVALGLLSIGTVALIAVLTGSVRFVLRIRHLEGRPPWPPTFSTGVYALGASQVGRLLNEPVISRLADAAAVATICLWVITVLAHLPALARLRLRPRRAR